MVGGGGVIFFFFNNCILKSSWSRPGGVEFVEFLILNNSILNFFHDPVLVGLLLSTIRSA